jgi:hypothetical protein
MISPNGASFPRTGKAAQSSESLADLLAGLFYVSGKKLRPGQIVHCEIVATQEYDLIGGGQEAALSALWLAVSGTPPALTPALSRRKREHERNSFPVTECRGYFTSPRR